jgi:hypothetical protein
MTYIIGIDPGITKSAPGGVAAIAPNGEAQVWTVPIAFLDILQLLTPYKGAIAVVEDVKTWVQDCDSRAVFRLEKLFRHQERCLCALDALGIEYVLVQPAVWQRALGLIGEGKDAAVSRAIALHPECRHQITVQSRNGRAKDLDGCADALLMAEWLRMGRSVAA